MNLSLCKSCWTMTKTIDGNCGKCKASKEHLCVHCRFPIKIRNQSTYCDHLNYPDNCEVCKSFESMSGSTSATRGEPLSDWEEDFIELLHKSDSFVFGIPSIQHQARLIEFVKNLLSKSRPTILGKSDQKWENILEDIFEAYGILGEADVVFIVRDFIRTLLAEQEKQHESESLKQTEEHLRWHEKTMKGIVDQLKQQHRKELESLVMDLFDWRENEEENKDFERGYDEAVVEINSKIHKLINSTK